MNARVRVLAGGGAAAAWRRHLRRHVAPAVTVEHLTAWPAQLAEVRPLLRDGPLSGRTLAEVAGHLPRSTSVAPPAARRQRGNRAGAATSPPASDLGSIARGPAAGRLASPAPTHDWSGSTTAGDALPMFGRQVRNPPAVAGLPARMGLGNLQRYLAGFVPSPNVACPPAPRDVGAPSADPVGPAPWASRPAAADWFADRATAVGKRLGVARSTTAKAALHRIPAGGPKLSAAQLEALALEALTFSVGDAAPSSGDRVPSDLWRSALARTASENPLAPATEGGAVQLPTPLPSSTAPRTRSVPTAGVDHVGVGHVGVDRAGVDHAGVDLAGVDLAGVDLAGVDLAGVDRAGVDHAVGPAGADPREVRRLVTDTEVPSAPDLERRSRPSSPAREARIGRPMPEQPAPIDEHELERLVTRIFDDAARRHGIEV
jgi:hypothetical protein